MKIILLKNIKKLGNSGDIVDVKNGYAMNFLIPQKIAVSATQEEIKKLQELKDKKQQKKIKLDSDLEKIIKKIENKKIKILKLASDKGKLFSAVTLDEILTALKNNFKVDLNKRKIKIDPLRGIKEVGEHKIEFKIGKDKIQLIIDVITA
ncbi:50S ribosomal protein L9 [Candidatus Parcubacteria bacterium]|nr:50S ribosomal protein L9 [Patescibacteria group bacterium]MBU4482164.1 50S ribosomal protein L9 [Patescibacteria group bacterium]MCG2686552.1 50S ribosomal protein L9 [Candidatus Parcubacteria bacterium]